ncbi:MAG TPA: hypothetical protein VFK68_03840, partial [Propionibacteriaceae bacterium]|nr:hypothetical protein [Propionibacteriaceae bacterium]
MPGPVPRTKRARKLTFATETLLLQIGVLMLVGLLSASLYTWVTYQQLTADTEARALAVAQSIAADPDVRDVVTRMSALPALPDNQTLRTGPVQTIGEAMRE